MEESTAHNSGAQLDEEMNVYLKIMKIVPMKIKGSDTIATLKANINQKEGISELNQKLFLDGKHLPDALRIVDSGIQNYATLHLIAMDSVALNLFINIQPDNRIIALETKACETVHNIKAMIQRKEGFLANSFTLVFNGNLLEDKSILASIGIRNNSTIHLISGKKEVFTLFVKAQGKEAVKLSVKVVFTVRDVKAIVMSLIGETFTNSMRLYYAGRLLEDSKTLAFYDIEEGSRLDLLSTSVMQIFVMTCSGKTLTIEVKEHHTVKELKAKILKKLGIANSCKIRLLVYAGKTLQDDMDLTSYGIQSHCTLWSYLTWFKEG